MGLRTYLKRKISERYRLMVIDENTYKQTIYFVFSLGRMAATVVVVLGLFWLLNTMLIVFTPIREWIPGYTDPEVKEKQRVLLTQIQELEKLVTQRDSFIKTLQVASGYDPQDSNAIKRILQQQTQIKTADKAKLDALKPTLGAATATSVRLVPVDYTASLAAAVYRIWPVEGIITRGFNPQQGHYAIDVAAAENAPVHAMAEGVVVLAEYSAQTGYVLGIQHPGGILSFYKHNSLLFKKVGAYVQGGEAIAVIGNKGTHSTGPHLHFEIWLQGQPVDPQAFLADGKAKDPT